MKKLNKLMCFTFFFFIDFDIESPEGGTQNNPVQIIHIHLIKGSLFSAHQVHLYHQNIPFVIQ